MCVLPLAVNTSSPSQNLMSLRYRPRFQVDQNLRVHQFKVQHAEVTKGEPFWLSDTQHMFIMNIFKRHK